jgi:hypothetical protein
MQRLAAIGFGVVALASAPAQADTRIVTEERIQMRIPGNQSDTTSEVTLWLAGDRGARRGGSSHMILRLDRGEVYVVDDATRSYRVLPLGGGAAPGAAPARLEKTGQTRQISQRTAEEHRLSVELHPGQTADIALWISTDVGVDLDAFRAYTNAAADAMGMAWMKSLVDVDGYPVLVETKMEIAESSSRLLSISEASPPDGIYELPAGYTRK